MELLSCTNFFTLYFDKEIMELLSCTNYFTLYFYWEIKVFLSSNIIEWTIQIIHCTFPYLSNFYAIALYLGIYSSTVRPLKVFYSYQLESLANYLYLPFISSPVIGQMYCASFRSSPAFAVSTAALNAGLSVNFSSFISYNTKHSAIQRDQTNAISQHKNWASDFGGILSCLHTKNQFQNNIALTIIFYITLHAEFVSLISKWTNIFLTLKWRATLVSHSLLLPAR